MLGGWSGVNGSTRYSKTPPAATHAGTRAWYRPVRRTFAVYYTCRYTEYGTFTVANSSLNIFEVRATKSGAIVGAGDTRKPTTGTTGTTGTTEEEQEQQKEQEEGSAAAAATADPDPAWCVPHLYSRATRTHY